MTLSLWLKEDKVIKKLTKKILKLNLNPKKEYLILGISEAFIVVTTLVSFVLLKDYRVLFIGIVALILFTQIYLSKYDVLLEKRRSALELEFVEIFSYLRIYLSNRESVYLALKHASEYTSSEMKKEVNNFIEKIDEDKSIIPFIKFGEIFGNKVIEEVMISLFQMVDGGFTESYLNQFISIFDGFKNRYQNEEMIKRYKKIDFFNSLCLFGSGYIMLVLLLIVMNVMGGMVNGF